MINYPKVYRSIFQVNQGSFDPEKNYYTVFIDCTKKEKRDAHTKFYDALEDQFAESFMPESIMRFQNDEENLMGRIIDHIRKNNIGDANYVFFVDLSIDEDADDCLVSFFEQFERNRGLLGRSMVTIIFILPSGEGFDYIDGDDEGDPCKTILSKRTVNNVLIYNHDIYCENELASSLIFALELLSNKNSFETIKEQRDKKCLQFEGVLKHIQSNDVRTEIEKFPVNWMSIIGVDSKNRLAAFKNYAKMLLESVQSLNYDCFSKLLEKEKKQFINIFNTKDFKNKLERAFLTIPVISINNSDDGRSFRTVIRERYGIDAETVIELTFKVVQKQHSIGQVEEESIRNRCCALFKDACSYGEKDLYETIKKLISEYLKNLHEELKSGLSLQKKLLEEDGLEQFKTELERYIDQYVSNDCLQAWINRIQAMKRFIDDNPMVFLDSCNVSKDYYDKIEQAKAEIQTVQRRYDFQRDLRLTRKEFLSVFSGGESHFNKYDQNIKNAIAGIESGTVRNVGEISKHLFAIKVHPQLTDRISPPDDIGSLVVDIQVGKFFVTPSRWM